MGKLTDARARAVRHSGRTKGDERHGDGEGLMLSVKRSGAKSWVQSLVIQGRRRTFGLGGYPLVPLKQARETASENRKVARAGGNPLAERARRRSVPTFREMVPEVVDVQSTGWTCGGKSRRQWEASLRTYAYPRLADLRVDAITTADVLAVLTPLWGPKRETARRVRQRVSTVLRWCVAQGLRPDDPAGPALLEVLPKGGRAVQHHRHVHYTQMADVIARVRESGAFLSTMLSFEFLVLTAARSGEARGARWSEIDLKGRKWLIPEARMKIRKPHRVPLSDRALEVLRDAAAVRQGNLVFPSPRGRQLSDMTLSKILRDFDIDAVPHGCRTTFRVWGSEVWAAGRRDGAREELEAALAHAIPGVEGDYALTDVFDRRRPLMQAWADYLGGAAAEDAA